MHTRTFHEVVITPARVFCTSSRLCNPMRCDFAAHTAPSIRMPHRSVGVMRCTIRRVTNSPRAHVRRENLQTLLALPPSHTHVPNKEKVFEAAVFLYNTYGEHSERAKLAANLFRKSLGTNAKIADVKLDNDTLHVKLIRYFEPLKLVDFQWVSVCKRDYSVTPPTHKLETFLQRLDSLSVGPELRATLRAVSSYDTIHHEINAHTWVPARKKMTKHPVLQVR